MEHNQAVRSNAVERYLLLEMSPDEQNEFEEHYFSCMACADDVRTAMQFREAARGRLALDREVARESPRRWWMLPQLIPVSAAAVLACVVGYQGTLLRELTPVAVRQVEAVVLRDTERGAVAHIPPGGTVFDIKFEALNRIDAYECQIAPAGGGSAVATQNIVPNSDGEATLELSRAKFPKGNYTVTLRANQRPVSQGNFIVE